MARQATWTNEDGLSVGFGPRDSLNDNGAVVETTGNVEVFQMNLHWDELPAAPGTAPLSKSIPLPANAVINDAKLQVLDAFTSGGSTTLTIGLVDAAGAAIDADGIDATVAKAALSAGATIACDGALVGADVGSAAAYISTTTASGPWTAGEAVLTIEYTRQLPSAEAADPIDGIVGSL